MARAVSFITVLHRDVEDKRDRYHEHHPVWAALEGRKDSGMQPGDVRLVSLAWLMDLANKGGTLHRRQELPEEAFLSTAQLQAIEQAARPGFFEGHLWDAARAMLSGQGFFKHFCLFLKGIVSRKNNVDHLLPIIAIS
jgi:hypothetical protein